MLFGNIFRQKIDLLVAIIIYDEVQSIFSQTVEQIEVVKDIVLLEVSKLKYSVMNKNQGEQTQIPPEKKTLEKGEWDCFSLLHLLD